MNKNIIIIIAMLLTSGYAYSQTNVFKQAETFFAKGDYYAAAQLYAVYLGVGNDSVKKEAYHPYFIKPSARKLKQNEASKATAVYHLAESYRLYHDMPHAEPWYKKSAEENSKQFPLSGYWYGVTLRANEKYDSAVSVITDFLSRYNTQDDYRAAAEKELKNLQFIRSQLAKTGGRKFQVKKFDGPKNIAFPRSGATILHNNTIVFTAAYVDSIALKQKTDPYKNRLFSTVVNNGTWQQATLLDIPGTAAGVEQGTASFSPDGTTVYFTQWEKNGSKATEAAIWSSTRSAGGWQAAIKLAGVNMTGYNSIQPSVTGDGKYIFFASDMPGGQGRYDVWYAELNTGGAGKPINAGAVINTKDDEQSPYFSKADKRLVFAANGRIGMGGYDLFSATGNAGEWAEPVNMGAPINSSRDDLYFSASNPDDIFSYAYFSSDRNSDCCLELFTLKELPRSRSLTGTVTDCNTGKLIREGTVYFTEPATGILVDSVKLVNGSYEVAIGDRDSLHVLAVSHPYEKNESTVSVAGLLYGDEESDLVKNEIICLKDSVAVEISLIEKEQLIYFDFDKFDLKPESKEKLDMVVDFLNRHAGLTIDVGGYTDELGSEQYNLDLAMQRSKVAAAYMISKGISKDRVNLKSYGKCCPVKAEKLANGDDDPNARQLNRRVGFTVKESL